MKTAAQLAQDRETLYGLAYSHNDALVRQTARLGLDYVHEYANAVAKLEVRNMTQQGKKDEDAVVYPHRGGKD